MDKADLAHFAALIRDRLSRIEAEDRLGQDGRAIVRLDQQSVGRLSRMDALQNQAMAKAQQARRGAEAHRLRAALGRIASGEFGLCEDCGERIAKRQLDLNPAVMMCISCASG